MQISLILRIHLLMTLFFVDISGEKSLPKITNIQLSTEEGFRIYQHWTTQAFTSLLSAFLQEKLSSKQLDTVPDQFTDCFFSAQTVPPMAKCIVQLFRKEFVGLEEKGRKRKKDRMEIYGAKSGRRRNEESNRGKRRRQEDEETGADDGRKDNEGKVHRKPNGNPKWQKMQNNRMNKYGLVEWEEGRRRRRQRRGAGESAEQQKEEEEPGKKIRTRSSYSLIEPTRTLGMSPIGGVARLLMARVLESKNRTEPIPWQKSVERLKQLKRIEDEMKRQQRKWRDNVIGGRKPSKGRRQLWTMKMTSGGKSVNLDEKIAKLVREGIQIGMRMTGENGTMEEEEEEEEERRMRRKDVGEGSGRRSDEEEEEEKPGRNGRSRLVEVLSPRFLSVTERKAKTKTNMLSPSLFTLHNKGLKGLERDLSVPNLLKGAHFTGRDQQEWLNLIMEASGVNDQVESLKDLLSSDKGHNELAKRVGQRYKREFKGLYLTKENVRHLLGRHEERKIDTWEGLERDFTAEQRKQLNRTGFASLNEDQIKFLYGPNSPYNDSEALDRLLPIVRNCSSVTELIEADINRLAQMRSFDIRQNDVVLRPSFFNPAILNPKRTSQPIILSPIVFSPTILSPTIMGPAILSPRVFSPPILSPRIMTPLVFSPFLFSSIILTPIIMQPFILSPGLLNSVILSPFIMNPMIMSSQIFHPFILSPLIMSPGILNPSSLSPVVLSPFVLGPQIFSPKFVSGLFLSPYALSPVFMSPVYAYLVVLSPSWLS